MHARVIKRHREYELVYLLAPTITPGGASKVGDMIREVIDELEGKLLKVDLWGIRPLAYRIRGHKQGIYYYTRFVATQGAVEEMERRLKLADSVLRFLTVRRSIHEVDPAAYTIKTEEAQFKGIDEIHESLQAESALPEEPSPEPVEGPSPEPSPEPVEGPSPELVEGPSPEPSPEPVEGPVEGPSPELVEGPSPEPSPEPVEGPVEAAAAEPAEQETPAEETAAAKDGDELKEEPEIELEVDDGTDAVPDAGKDEDE